MKTLQKYTISGDKNTAISRFTALSRYLELLPTPTAKYIHVAGTNGKGSVCAYICTGLEQQLQKQAVTGKFTSPFVRDITERITVNNTPIPHRDLERLCTVADKAIDEIGCGGYSQFEVLAAAALLYFAENKVDYAVIETGVGGLLDCTNIINPTLSVITKIGYDHINILGSSIREIATHKAGIIKQGVPVVTDPTQFPAAMQVICETALQKSSRLVVPDLEGVSNVKSGLFGNTFAYFGEQFTLGMGGRHQVNNALTAIEAIRVLALQGGSANSACDFSQVKIPARMQIVSEKPLVIVDGAHNPDSIRVVMESIASIPNKRIVVTGMLKSKDYRACVRELAGSCDDSTTFILTDGFSAEAVPVCELADVFREECEAGSVTGSVTGLVSGKFFCRSVASDAVELALKLSDSDSMVFVCGSLYLAGEVLKGF